MLKSARNDGVSPDRRALLLLAACAIVRLSGKETAIEIYANESWYRERPEVEREWTGVLRKRPLQEGPNSRTALRFTLHVRDRSLPVYAAGAMEKLEPFTGKRATVRAKLVSLRAEGYGDELWIATIREAPTSNARRSARAFPA